MAQVIQPKPRAAPWAVACCPFRAEIRYSFNLLPPLPLAPPHNLPEGRR
jgi:hypothetical protein